MLRLLPLLLLVMFTRTQAETTLVSIPVALEYPLLQQLLVSQLFTGPGKSRELLQDPSNCSRIDLTDPQLSPQGENLEIIASVSAHIGLNIAGSCRPLTDWKGKTQIRGRPVIAEGGRSVRMETGRINLIDMDGKTVTTGPLWNMANDRLQVFLREFILDFSSPLQGLKQLLPDVLPRHSVSQLQTTIDSLQVSNLLVTENTLNSEVHFEVAPVPPEPPVEAFTPEELEAFEKRWQMMDSILVLAVKQYASAANLQPLRNELLEILLDSRYRVLEALSQPPDTAEDSVRHWFIESWQRLNPVVRQIGQQDDQHLYWLWLSALTATDALYVIDQLGPSVGLEISEDGLRRLARLINAGAGDDQLIYDKEIDPQLQELWQEQLQQEIPDQSRWEIHFSLFPEAEAAGSREKLNSWVPEKHELDTYLPIIETTLIDTGSRLGKPRLPADQNALFRSLVMATAWQESCWRQYVVLNKRIEPLRSSSGDVGLMQVNENVWRGIYDRNKLRWDIDYNITAGSEILLNYLVSYAIKRGEHKQPGGISNLARASYSAYNGGPGQLQRYRSSKASSESRKVDELFWNKYQQVAQGKQMNVAGCFGRDPSSLKLSSAAPTPTPSISTSLRDENWVANQPAGNFTLQLASMSSRQGARQFIADHSLVEGQILQVKSKGKTLYVVLQGSYASESAAATARQKLARLKPWVRQFKDLK